MNHPSKSTASTDRRLSQTSDPFIAEDLKQMELAPNYSAWLYRLLKPFIGSSVLEVGSGTGTITEHLLCEEKTVTGIEPNPFCIQELRNKFDGSPHFHLLPKTIEDCSDEELRQTRFATIVSVNVLEHIENDQVFLKRVAELLPPGGRLVLIVPAVPQAFGTIDRAVGHFRRYSAKGLRNCLITAHLRPIRLRYSNAIGLLGWFINGRIRHSTRQNIAQIRLFNALAPYLSTLERIIPPFCGLSLLAVAEKPQKETDHENSP